MSRMAHRTGRTASTLRRAGCASKSRQRERWRGILRRRPGTCSGSVGSLTPGGQELPNDQSKPTRDSHFRDPRPAYMRDRKCGRRAMRQRVRRLRYLEAAIRRTGPRQGHWRGGRLGSDGDELRERDHRGRSRPAKFWVAARSVSCQARGSKHRRTRPQPEAIAGRAVRFDPAALWRATRAAARDLGNGDWFWQPARQPEHALLDRYARLYCRRPEYFTEQLYAALQLIDRGVLSAA